MLACSETMQITVIQIWGGQEGAGGGGTIIQGMKFVNGSIIYFKANTIEIQVVCY